MPQPIVKPLKKRITSNLLLQPWLLPLVQSIESPIPFRYSKSSPLLKTIKFLKISYRDGVKAIVCDADHLILAEIPRDVYLQHERKMRARFTADNKNVVIAVRSVEFKFYSRQEVYTKFGILIETGDEVLQKFCIAELRDFEFFNRDEVVDNVVMPWIYHDPGYCMYGDEMIQDEVDPFPVFHT